MPSTATPSAGPPPPPGEAPVTAEELAAILDVTMRLGRLIAAAGAAAFRVRETMRRTASSFGIAHTEVTFNVDTLQATLASGALRETVLVRLSGLGVDMNRICRIALLSRELADQPGARTTAALARELDVIEAEQSPYPIWITPWVLGGSCGAFCAVIGGSPWQIAAAFAGTFAGHLLRLRHLRTHPPLTTFVVTCAFVSALVSWATARALGAAAGALALGVDPAALAPGQAVLASVLYLIPGVPLVNGLIDLLHFDFGAGLARSAYATIVVVCIAVGVFAFLSLTGFALR